MIDVEDDDCVCVGNVSRGCRKRNKNTTAKDRKKIVRLVFGVHILRLVFLNFKKL